MSSNSAQEPTPDAVASVRSLPPQPNLEFERKRAKKLLAQLRREKPTGEFKLADAQFIIAREYGFRSWPRLVEYFAALDRQTRRPWPPSHQERGRSDVGVKGVLAGHRGRHVSTALMLATFVPRFYGATAEEVLASTISEADAQLVVARQACFASWDALMSSAESPRRSERQPDDSPLSRAHAAVRANDVERLRAILDAHPEFIQPQGTNEPAHDYSLTYNTLWHERRERTPAARALTDLIVSRGAQTSGVLNIMLLSAFRVSTEEVAFMLERGADPAFVAPNGISALEYALIRFWNGAAVDLVAQRVTPRKAFWIAAGVGDVPALERYFDRNGVLTDAARKHRPDFTAIGPASLPSLPNAPDVDIIWEAVFIAALNCRFASIDVLLRRGFPIDFARLESTLLHFAVGNRMVPLVEFLVSRGARVDIKGWMPALTAREIAEEQYQEDPSSETGRILELCGGRVS